MTSSSITWKETRFLKVPLSPDEVRARGEQLANILKSIDDTEATQKAEKERMKDAMNALTGQCHRLASIVRDGVEERAVEVEMRVDLGLRLVEEIRLDTGEVVSTRGVTEDDKVRAQQRAQTEIPGTTKAEGEPGA